MEAWPTAHENILTLKKESRVRNFFSKTDSKRCDINCIQKVTEIFRQTGKIILQVYLQAREKMLYCHRNQGYARKGTDEMRLFTMFLKSEYMDSALRSFQYELSGGSLSRPYGTENDVKRWQ